RDGPRHHRYGRKILPDRCGRLSSIRSGVRAAVVAATRPASSEIGGVMMTATSATAATPARIGKLALLGHALPWIAAIAYFFAASDYLTFGTQIMIWILFAISLDLVLGYAGVVTLGHSAFFGIGAYAAGI